MDNYLTIIKVLVAFSVLFAFNFFLFSLLFKKYKDLTPNNVLSLYDKKTISSWSFKIGSYDYIKKKTYNNVDFVSLTEALVEFGLCSSDKEAIEFISDSSNKDKLSIDFKIFLLDRIVKNLNSYKNTVLRIILSISFVGLLFIAFT